MNSGRANRKDNKKNIRSYNGQEIFREQNSLHPEMTLYIMKKFTIFSDSCQVEAYFTFIFKFSNRLSVTSQNFPYYNLLHTFSRVIVFKSDNIILYWYVFVILFKTSPDFLKLISLANCPVSSARFPNIRLGMMKKWM